MNTDSKYSKLRAHLKKGWSITGAEAMFRYRLYRLSDFIYKHRNAGWPIETDDSKGHARYFIPNNKLKLVKNL